MDSKSIKSLNKYLLSYKDTSNRIHQMGIYAHDAHDCMLLAQDFNSYVQDNPNSVIRIQQKF